ncbi:hypothetical protein IHE45_19G006100 [Dioscorea alata]|uniref:Uncharacterized protein n=1 Tax=Dioscorea alata TaxID=55571 RepID=A0ACB7TW69_DIOAL|nr:hypothetical protein IHE45_19G006100 [Dioscorea alata]
MLMIQFPTSIRKIWINEGQKVVCRTISGNHPLANSMANAIGFRNSLGGHCVNKVHSVSTFGWPSINHYQQWRRSQQSTNSWLCHSNIHASSDEDYRSSRNIAISLFRWYRNVIDRGGGDNLKEFISAGVNAYALGCTDEGLRKELISMKDSNTEIEELQNYGGGTSIRFKILSEEISECILWLSIVFITILCTPQPTVVRWSSTQPVSTETMLQWKGFCALIANAYYTRGMAWLPVKTLQLEQMAVMGSAEEPSVVASRMRLVFSTLEVVSPQWPRV